MVIDRLRPAARQPAAPAPVFTGGAVPSPAGVLQRHPRARIVFWATVAVMVALVGIDQLRPPAGQVTARVLLAGIHLYQATLSPRMPGLGVQCRFTPTCSHYAEGAIARYGAVPGALRAVWRIARCGPWTPRGTWDPP